MKEVKIEKGIALPKPLHGMKRSPLHKLEVGDSFLIEDMNEQSQRHHAWVIGIKVSIRTDEQGKRRLWRTG